MNTRAGKQVSIVGLCLDIETRDKLASLGTAGIECNLVADFSQYPADLNDRLLKTTLAAGIPDAILIDFDKQPTSAAHIASLLHQAYGTVTAIFAVSVKSDPGAIIASMRAGCREYLVRPVTTEKLVEAFQQLANKRVTDRQTSKSGHVIAIAGAKGGTGVSTISAHLATFLARSHDLKVLLVDQHPDLGDIGTYLGLSTDGYSFFDVVSNVRRLDAELVSGFVQRHESGVHILPSRSTSEPPNVTAEDVEETVGVLRTLYDVLLVEYPPGLAHLDMVSIEKPDQVALVVVPELACVKNLIRCLDHLSSLGYPQERINLIVNRHTKKNNISDEQIASAAKKAVNYRIPNNYVAVSRAGNIGVPMHPSERSEFVMAVSTWANDIAGRTARAKASVSDRREERRGFGSILGIGS